MNVSFYTLGCKVNQYETQAMRCLLEQNGHTTDDYQPGADRNCDAIVVNSCTVTAESDRKLRQTLRRCRRENPSAILVLTGCMPQAFPDKAATMAEVDILLGNAERNALPKHLASYVEHRQRIVDISAHTSNYEVMQIDSFVGRTRAFVKIQDGCNRFCSYCIIPYARGRVRSRDPEDIRRELSLLAAHGYKEVVLVGINLTAYGQDIGLTIADAVDAACSVPGICRIRLGSLEPDYMTDDILKRLSAQPKLCPQFHVALQSGCNATLRRMNRHYTTEEFDTLCTRLRQLFPGCALTTDVMVGFPGESEEEFAASLDFVRRIAFSKVHVFAYSRRPGTVADRMPSQLTVAEKTDRSRKMIAACKQTAADYASDYIGRTVDVLLETPLDNGITEGHTDTYLTVLARTDKPSGDMVRVLITAADEDTLVGEEIR